MVVCQLLLCLTDNPEVTRSRMNSNLQYLHINPSQIVNSVPAMYSYSEGQVRIFLNSPSNCRNKNGRNRQEKLRQSMVKSVKPGQSIYLYPFLRQVTNGLRT